MLCSRHAELRRQRGGGGFAPRRDVAAYMEPIDLRVLDYPLDKWQRTFHESDRWLTGNILKVDGGWIKSVV